MDSMHDLGIQFHQIFDDADMYLIGLGEELEGKSEDEELHALYKKLGELLKGKNYFIISQNKDDGIWDAGFDPGRIVASYTDREPLDENGEDKQWIRYTKWLSGSLNRKLCVVELGVLISNPNVIRWPFERIVMLNLKSHLLRINQKIPQLPTELGDRGTSIPYNPLYFFPSL